MQLKSIWIFVFWAFVGCGDSGTSTPTNACVPSSDGIELCDGVDNDCNGIVDDGYNVGDGCTLGSQTCSGVLRCSDDTTRAVCELTSSGTDEVCDGLDNDCDGDVDEDLGLGEACTSGEGPCANSGQTICGTDGTVVCDAVAGVPGGEEVCDGMDNNCDGQIDETFADRLGQDCSGPGACADALTICDPIDATQVVCAVVPGVEVCDGIDNDCDDAVDEDFDIGTACTAGIGACAVSGTKICSEDGTQTVCDAVALSPQTAVETACDMIDENCDGTVDEGCDDDNDGYCDKNLTYMAGACPNGGMDCNDANDAVNPGATEICDTIDNDCDNQIDVDAVDGVDYYLDCDGDGFAVNATGARTKECTKPTDGAANTACSTASATWTTTTPNTGAIDCGPAEPNAKPGQNGWFSTAFNGTPLVGYSVFDYNCDGSATKRLLDSGDISAPCPNANWLQLPNNPGICLLLVDDPGEGYLTTPPACGVSASYAYCSYTRIGTTNQCSGTRTTRMQPQECN